MMDSNIDYRYLKAFLKTAKYLNFSKAAEELKMPKSTFHDKLKAYDIDVRLFKKRGRD